MRKCYVILALLVLLLVSGCGLFGYSELSGPYYSCDPPRSVRTSARASLSGGGLAAPPDTGVFSDFVRAYREREQQLVHLYLRAGIMSYREYGSSLLHYAAAIGDLALVKKGLDCRLGVDERNRKGQTPLHLAVGRGRHRAVKLLLASGADPNSVNSNRRSPLHLAVTRGDEKLLDRLLESGADPNLRDERDRTPFYLAVVRGRRELAERLGKNGADPDVELVSDSHSSKVRGGSLLHLAVYNQLSEPVEWLLEFGANPDVRAVNNWTPLHLAAWRGNAQIIRELARGGANVNAVGGTPLDEYIFEARTPLHIAAYEGNLRATRALLRAGADPTIPTREGWKARHLASYFDHDPVLKLLESAEKSR